jgi:CYTH domain-containing protein
VRNDSAPPGKELKYAIVERERRFLLAGPLAEPSIRVVAITDHYLTGTRLRLRRSSTATDQGEEVVYKLTQKIPAPGGGPGLITTIYLNKEEHQILAVLPAAVLNKTRHSVPPFGIDVFGGALNGLYIAEVEFSSDEEMSAFLPVPFLIADVTGDSRFTGGHLVTVTRHDLAQALADYGLRLPG